MQARKNKLTLIGSLAGLFLIFQPMNTFAGPVSDAAKNIPIQNNGRVKAFDSFCRQTVETIAGRERWNKTDAITLVLNAVALEDKIKDLPWIQINLASLRQALGLSAGSRYFSYNDILPSLGKIEALMQGAKEKRDADKPTTAVEQEAELLYNRLVMIKDLRTGESLRVMPAADENSAWESPYQTTREHALRFKQLVSLFSEKKTAEFSAQCAQWNEWVDQTTGGAYRKTLRLEVLYSGLRPFQWAWIAYLAAFLVLSTLKNKTFGKPTGIGLIVIAMAFHTLGLTLRVLVLQRPPVSNMYESMVYMNWAVMVFAALFALGTRNIIYVTAGSAVSALVMIYGNLLPIDSNLEVLVPVLRSNYWLTIHVMTIVSSYGAFGLAMALGHRHLILEIAGKLPKRSQEDSAQVIYRVIQLGVLLLGIGTVLGGVWANESWGRFWGWDPKETWALITFLAYLVVVHLKYSKKIDAHWLAISSVLGFFFVLMTWYGVNFVLGRGLHSYGFGSGGMKWIVYYLVAELVFLAFVLLKPNRRN